MTGLRALSVGRHPTKATVIVTNAALGETGRR